MHIQTELLEALEKLSQKSEVSLRDKEHRLLWDIISESKAEVINQLSPTEVVQLIRGWNRRLRRSLNRETPPVRVLTGFSSGLDIVYFLSDKEYDVFTHWAAAKSQKSVQWYLAEAINLANSRKDFSAGVETLVEVHAAIIAAILYPDSALKPPIKINPLREQLQEFLESRAEETANVVRILGGASGNMASVLNALGVDVVVHWAYHPKELADVAPPNLRRLVIEQGKPQSQPGSEGVEYTAGRHAIGDPLRSSFCMQYPLGMTASHNPHVVAKHADRLIFGDPYHLREKKGWSKIALESADGERVIIENSDAILGENGWPFIPLFGSWGVADGGTLVFRVAGDETMSEISEKADYLVLTGLQAFGAKIFSSETRAFLLKHLDRQLERMTARGVLLHAEIGITSPDGLKAMTELIRNNIKSIGLNTGELEKFTGDKQFETLATFLKERSGQAPSDEAILVRYERARHFAATLKVDELYVHGNDVDLILRKGAPRAALWQEVETVLFAKGAVIGSLLLRSLKGRWKEVIKKKVPPVLLKKGFIVLLELAKELAKAHVGQGIADHLESEIFKQIVFSGYYYQKEDPESYSVLVVPVMWPNIKENISTAGAGDITSTVVAVFAGK